MPEFPRVLAMIRRGEVRQNRTFSLPILVSPQVRDKVAVPLRKMLLAKRADYGFIDYAGDGKWDGTPHGLTAAEFNHLLDAAGIVPDKMTPHGDCGTCKFGPRDRGWGVPCISCHHGVRGFWTPKRATRKQNLAVTRRTRAFERKHGLN